jgi:hypothetical protein
MAKPRSKLKKKQKTAKKEKRSRPKHSWRLCPSGEHWVRLHSRSNAPSVTGYCRTNSSHKDQIYPFEISEIAEKRFSKLRKSDLPNRGLEEYESSDAYDHLVGGWTRFWNEVLRPDIPLDPNLVKALIATESRFKIKAEIRAGKRAGMARGLMQVTDWSAEILKDEKGELLDHLVNVSQKELYDPNLNIAAGIRWLFRKRETASATLDRKANWIEAVAEYKSYLGVYTKNPKHKQMSKLTEHYERLKRSKKK